MVISIETEAEIKEVECPNCQIKRFIDLGSFTICYKCQSHYCEPCGKWMTYETYKGSYKQPGNTCSDCRDIKYSNHGKGLRSPINLSKRFAILQRDNFTCRYCGQSAPNVKLNVDHIVPISKGGTNDDSNLITACFPCNRGKSARLI